MGFKKHMFKFFWLLAKGRGGAEREFYDSTLIFICPPGDQGKGWAGLGILQFDMGLKKYMFKLFCSYLRGGEGSKGNSTILHRFSDVPLGTWVRGVQDREFYNLTWVFKNTCSNFFALS